MTEKQKIPEWFEIDTPQGKIHFPTNVVYSSINLSGGFDSWVMLYLYLYSLKQNKNFDVHIYPTHVIRTNYLGIARRHRRDTKPIVQFIIDILRKQFPEFKNIHDPIIDYCEYWWASMPQWGDYHNKHAVQLDALDWWVQQEFKEVHKDKINEHTGKVFCHLTANNLAPVGFMETSTIEFRNHKETKELVYPDSMSSYHPSEKPTAMPFRNLDKRTIYWLAEKYNQLDLFEKYSWSCESNEHANIFFSQPCNTCWQCKERNWARENYKKI